MNFFVICFLIMQASSFSLGDELGFAESLGNLEGGKRRAINFKNGPPNLVGVLPASQQTYSQNSKSEKRIISRSTGTQSFTVPFYAQTVKKPAPVSLMTEAKPLPLGVPAFRPIPKSAVKVPIAQRRSSIAVDTQNPRVSINNKLVESAPMLANENRTYHVMNPVVAESATSILQSKQTSALTVPVFQAMPNSISRIYSQKSEGYNQEHKHPNYLQFEEPKFDLKDVTVEELAATANVSVETIKHAIFVREQQMKAEHRALLASKLRQEFYRTSTSTSTTSTTTPKPNVNAIGSPSIQKPQLNPNVAYENKASQVMNAPKEYYPVGYDKNFDDNFKSKVDLPPTTFICSKQKHFPGLYADTDLGCMVFHVCALTDDGLVRKSFLCPENTLFDQTILKCNWWFYVDCKSSRSVYDSNIPISKSYQLMKSLTYFSKYNNQAENNNESAILNMQVLQDTMAASERKIDENSKQKLTTTTDAALIIEELKNSREQTNTK
ncbi:uncharacterized protein LOC119683141 isoform X2 [Teleopsis dalmanni]|uniref:uncharacterized protein LOC119683141 isoform X2 n=1 Tax=Teleopsis dalmanni TaxID=139649 RepID=UPI0018CF4B3A|nr:uncharacterized protein LOC119683141 isoform X2 [Teleopsis dalmanni]